MISETAYACTLNAYITLAANQENLTKQGVLTMEQLGRTSAALAELLEHVVRAELKRMDDAEIKELDMS